MGDYGRGVDPQGAGRGAQEMEGGGGDGGGHHCEGRLRGRGGETG